MPYLQARENVQAFNGQFTELSQYYCIFRDQNHTIIIDQNGEEVVFKSDEIKLYFKLKN